MFDFIKEKFNMFDRQFKRPVVGHGSTFQPVDWLEDFNTAFEINFPKRRTTIGSPQTVLIVDIFTLEKDDIDVSIEGRTVTIKGEGGFDLDSVRIYEQFDLADNKEIKTVQFTRGPEVNKLVFVFDTVASGGYDQQTIPVYG